MSIIEFSNINLRFQDKEIFRDFSLKIEKGEKLQIVGKSGNGKSTLLRILLGFQSCDSGELYIKNKLVTAGDFRETRKLFAYVNQDVTLRPGIARDVLQEVAKFSGNTYDGCFDKEIAELFEFNTKLLDKDTEELSGGERQRLGIILAIMLKRPVFLLDEVTSALDVGLKHKVVKYFYNCEETVITISHDNEWLELGGFRRVEW